MKRFLLLLFITFYLFGRSQSYSSFRMNLVSYCNPQGTVGIGTDDRKYSGCWGWFQTSTNKEYAIVGSSTGVYFIDISNPGMPVVRDYVDGKHGCTWREIKSYQNYCYVVSDDATPNRFQIIDMQYLPDSVHVVHDGTTYFERGHTLWIDKDKLYIGSETKQNGQYTPMTIYSLATPSNPAFLRSISTDASYIGIVHDMYVNNDTVFASCGNQGLYVFKYNSGGNNFSPLGSYTNYHTGSAYNHATCITSDKKTLVSTDEVPTGLPIRILDIQNLSNISTASTVNPHPQTTPHNPYVIGSRWAIVSCYEDGLNIYDITNPTNPVYAGYFDTHPQGGYNVSNYLGYRGNWGAYPYFPSGLIVALDMQNGMYLLDASNIYNQPVGFADNAEINELISIYPNPAKNHLTLSSAASSLLKITISNVIGEMVMQKQLTVFGKQQLDVSSLTNGAYFIHIENEKGSTTKKIIINNN